jgi:hypothetical protein
MIQLGLRLLYLYLSNLYLQRQLHGRPLLTISICPYLSDHHPKLQLVLTQSAGICSNNNKTVNLSDKIIYFQIQIVVALFLSLFQTRVTQTPPQDLSPMKMHHC